MQTTEKNPQQTIKKTIQKQHSLLHVKQRQLKIIIFNILNIPQH